MVQLEDSTPLPLTHTHSPITVVAPGPDPDPENYIFTNSQHHHPPNQAPAKKAPTNQAPKKYECGKLGPYIIKYICIRYILQQLANIYMSVAFIYWYWNLDIFFQQLHMSIEGCQYTLQLTYGAVSVLFLKWKAGVAKRY